MSRTQIAVSASDAWETRRLGDHVTFLRHGVNSRAELLPEGRVKYLHYGDVHACGGSYLSPASLPSLPDAKAARLDRLRDGDLVLVDASEDLDGVGKSVEMVGVGSTEAVPGLHTITARFDKAVLADGFKGLLQHCPPFAKHLRRLAAGTKVYATNRTHIAGIEMPIPPVPEQRAIAATLSGVDALLAGLDRLIAKKRDVRQAAMQQLLTSQTRLPGFEGEWEVRRLEEHVTFLRNGVNSRAELNLEGRVKYLHYGDIHACTGVYLSAGSLPSLPEAKAARLDRLQNGDLVFADASEDIAGVGKSVEISGLDDVEVVSGLHTIVARFDKHVLADGFKGFLQHCPPFAKHLRRLAAGTKVYATNRAHITGIEMPLPPAPEQVAIATVLSDMDAELSALEARREKTRDLKQAVMQELLAGRIRLIATGGADA